MGGWEANWEETRMAEAKSGFLEGRFFQKQKATLRTGEPC